MSSSIRNSNIFAAENYQKIFKAYSFIDYTAYDFDSLKQALINYIQIYYPEDFNDYIESSEFIAIVELIAYLGTSLAFRSDLNSRENFIDTAERRESVIRLAQMVNYVPRRNVPASGLFKLAAVQTNQPLVDSSGININDVTVYWNDPNNPDWFEQFIQISNAAFMTINPFGRPAKSGTIGNIPTDLYPLNNIKRQAVTYPITVSISGQEYPIDVCNPDFDSNSVIFERDPNPDNAFNFIYRNDSLGMASANTGFFLYFKQGSLMNFDANFDFPVPNRMYQIDVQDINQDDVYVQETDQNGNVLVVWDKVPVLSGENIIYNSIQFAKRNIFDVISGANDTITIRFADGNFGNVPTGLFRTWVRVSANQSLVIRPDDAQGMQIAIPYVGADQQQYVLRLVFNLEQTVGNAAPTETNEQIKLRAPAVFSTQSRMVNGSDYNVLPLVYGNQIVKIQSINRTFSGQSRYIEPSDPTGFHRDLLIFGQDGAIYKDTKNVETTVDINTTIPALVNSIQTLLRSPSISTFFYDEYLPQFESTIRVNPPNIGRSLLDLIPSENELSLPLYWKTLPEKFKNDTGYFTNSIDSSNNANLENTLSIENYEGGIYQAWRLIESGASLSLGTKTCNTTVPVSTVLENGGEIGSNSPYSSVGTVALLNEVQTNAQAVHVYPVFRTTLTSDEIVEISTALTTGVSFYMYFDLLSNKWGVSNLTITNQVKQPFIYPAGKSTYNPAISQIYSDWTLSPTSGIVYIDIAKDQINANTTYNISARGSAYIFESYRDVRFYWDANAVILDSRSGHALSDTIEILPYINTNNTVDNNLPVITNPVGSYINAPILFNISGVFTQEDGYTAPNKVIVTQVDSNNDGIADTPSAMKSLISPTDRVVFEYYTDEFTGYQGTRPWISNWGDALSETVGDIYVYFPINTSGQSLVTELYSPPYIANKYFDPITDYDYILSPKTYALTDSTFRYEYLDSPALILLNNYDQIYMIQDAVTAFYNDLNNKIVNKDTIVSNYFINKSFLLSTSTPGYGNFYTFEYQSTLDYATYPNGKIIVNVVDTNHYDKNGKSFTQNTNVNPQSRIPLHFKWNHWSPMDQRVDPSTTNIIDMVVITNSYYQDITVWKNSNSGLDALPISPTTEELRTQFASLNQYKMVSDSIVWNSGNFKILFGPQAAIELQATFKVVKSPSTNISENEIKTRVIQSIDSYFDIRNWDFGETFFYTELAAFIHQQLNTIISTVVIVPTNANSLFGDLFEIVAGPTELFLSTASVSNVQVVTALTPQNLRV